MSYIKAGMGDVVSNVVNAATAVSNVVRDPYLPETTQLLMRLHQLEQPKTGTSAPAVQGIGLNRVVGPLRLYVKARENPFVLAAAVAGIFLVPYWIGKTSPRR